MAVDLKVVFGILGNITASFLFISPFPTFWNIIKNKSVQDFSAIPYVCMMLNCVIWVIYGSPLVEFQLLVVTINGAGAVLSFSYLLVYFTFAPKKLKGLKALKLLLAMVLVFLFLLLLVLELIHDKNQRKIITGICGVICAMGMYASPLTIMCMVIRTRSVEFMPFFLSLFNFLNGAAWFGYAFVGKMDIFIAVPNGYGVLSGIAQLILYAIYKNTTPLSLVLKQQEVLGKVGLDIIEDPNFDLKPPKQITTTLEQQADISCFDHSSNLKPTKQITTPEEVISQNDCNQNDSPFVVMDFQTNLHQENIGKEI